MSDFMTDSSKSMRPPIEVGKHDAYLQGIVFLYEQKVRPYQGKERPNQRKIKFIFELPNLVKEDDKSTSTMSKTMNCTNNAKGVLIKTLSSVTKLKMSTEDVGMMLDDPTKYLLGKKTSLEVDVFQNGDNYITFVKEIIGLDERIEVPASTRPTFVFDPKNPDMKVWNELITFYTKKTIMDSTNASEFPEELHEQYLKDAEANAIKQEEYQAKRDTDGVGVRGGSDSETGAIE